MSTRQRQILELAANGLGDKEIARRLAISHRTVRTHFERLFRDYQVRSRSGAVAAWLRDRPSATPARPRDECPYSRPFPEAFSDCPAYQALEMVSLDISYRPLGRLWTCRHLAPKQEAVDRWYASCHVGGADNRERWAAALGRERLQKIDTLQRELASVTASFLDPLWRHKRHQLELVAAGADATAQTERLQATTRRLARRIDILLRQHRALLDEVHLPEVACRELIRVALDRLVTQQSVDFQLDVPDEVLALFPPDMRLFFRP
ncbi:MAG TPA: helix-turn-helix transcriptional regulator [Candidatus Sulfotelmatobacter sp.]|nr:helix-turn-helix transcriptional regulator [Candidatus Sulfotelmatobacter sp.]